MRTLTSLLLALTASACSTPPASRAYVQDETAALAALDARHRSSLDAFQAEQRRHEREHEFPARYEIEGLGALLVKDCRLIGWPGKAWLRAEFTLLNTVESLEEAPVLSLRMTDPASGEEAWAHQELALPFGMAFTRGSTYTGWIEMPTSGLHRREGWEWSLEVAFGEPEGASPEDPPGAL